ncbi:response regulator [Niabella aquatica]
MNNCFPAYQFEPLSPKSALKTLIVDDEYDMHYLLSNILKQRNIISIAAGSIKEAKQALKQHPDIFLIFLDNRLPDGQGYEYIRQFREISEAVIIMITAYDTGHDRKMAEDHGADYFIGKPFTKDNILEIVDHVLHHLPSG